MANTLGFQTAPQDEPAPPTLSQAASRQWVRRIAAVVNNMLKGKLNAVASVTLAASATTTTVIDARISPFSALLFSPLTAHAAAEIAAGGFYVSAQGDGTATLTHANNSQTDRNFTMAIIG